MSKIDILCIKYAETNEKKGKDLDGYSGDCKVSSKSEIDNSIKLEINANQFFMNTEHFFNSVKTTLEEFFDTIEKK